MYYLISILLGLVPEVLFLTLFLSYTKNLKDKRIMLFLCISISYFISMLIQQYKTIFYVLFIFLLYASLKIVYRKKTQIIDLFVASIPFMWISILSYLCFILLKDDMSNYYTLYIIDRIVLFIPLIFNKHYNKYYKIYCKMWNRNDNEKRPIKSITLRNISLILLNSFILMLNIAIIGIINFIM